MSLPSRAAAVTGYLREERGRRRHNGNLEVIVGDSTTVQIPTDRLCFSFIDGNHDAPYVRKDFEMAWSRTLPGGIVALHDYGGDLSLVTQTIHGLIGEHAGEVARFWAEGLIGFAQKR